MKFTIGADPELFLTDRAGHFVSAVGLIGGTKKEPLQVATYAKGFCVQEDNVAAEFNIPPSDNAQTFAENIDLMVNYLAVKAGELKLQIKIVPSARFDPAELKHATTLVFGCDADFNAWTGKQNPKPQCDDAQLRTCGGHVAVGTDLPSRMCIRAEDLYLGAPAILIDDDMRRRQLYGAAGCYRETTFGHEYRVLSNFWITSIERTKWIYEGIRRALVLVQAALAAGIEEEDFLEEDRSQIELAINTGSRSAVYTLDKKYGILIGCPHLPAYPDM